MLARSAGAESRDTGGLGRNIYLGLRGTVILSMKRDSYLVHSCGFSARQDARSDSPDFFEVGGVPRFRLAVVRQDVNRPGAYRTVRLEDGSLGSRIRTPIYYMPHSNVFFG